MKCYRGAEYVTRGVVRIGSDPDELGLSISSPLHPQAAEIWPTCRFGRFWAINRHRGVLTRVKQTATSGRRSQYREQVSTSRGTPIEAIAHTSASRQKFWLGCVCAALSACRAFTHVARANASGRRNRVTPMQRLPNAAKVSAQTGSRAAAVVSAELRLQRCRRSVHVHLGCDLRTGLR